MSSRRAVVIGGSGFVGARVVALLAGARRPEWPSFDEILVADVAPYEWREPAAPRVPVRSKRCDVRSRDDLRQVIAGAHTVFHLASMVHVGLRREPRIDEVNVMGTRHVVDVCRELGIRHLVYTSSEDVSLGEIPVVGGDESLPYPERPIHDYVRTKIEAERVVLAAHGTAGLRTVAIRPVHVYGAGDPHAIPTSLRAFAKGTVPFLLGDGTARFDVVHVDNVAHAHLLAAARLQSDDGARVVGGKAYLVNEDNAPNYFEFLRPYAEAANVRMPTRHLGRRRTAMLARAMEWAHALTGAEVPFHGFHVRVICQDFFFTSERARRELGYVPLVSPEEGRRRTEAWARTLAIS